MTSENIHSRLYQLDELILYLYNAVYAKIGNYKIKSIDVNKLNMNRFKLSDYDLDQIFSTIEFSRKEATDIEGINQYVYKRHGETKNCNIRIIPYLNKEDVNDMKNPVNVNQIIRTLLSELVVNGRTNNLLLPIINIDVIGEDLINYAKLKEIEIDENKFYSIEITEKYYTLMSLEQFTFKYPLESNSIRSIIYQATNLLYQINNAFPNFRHNSFLPKYIDCYLRRKKNDIDSELFIPELKLGNFFLSSIDNIVPNSAEPEKINLGLLTPYSDLYQLLNWLWLHHEINITNSPELIELFDIILPKPIRSNNEKLTKDLFDLLTDEYKKTKEMEETEEYDKYLNHPQRIITIDSDKKDSKNDVDKKDYKKMKSYRGHRKINFVNEEMTTINRIKLNENNDMQQEYGNNQQSIKSLLGVNTTSNRSNLEQQLAQQFIQPNQIPQIPPPYPPTPYPMPANSMPANSMPINSMPANSMPANSMPANSTSNMENELMARYLNATTQQNQFIPQQQNQYIPQQQSYQSDYAQLDPNLMNVLLQQQKQQYPVQTGGSMRQYNPFFFQK